MNSLFKKEEIWNAFEHKGYVKLRLIERNAADKLLALYHSINKNQDKGNQGYWTPNNLLKGFRSTSEFLLDELSPDVAVHLNGHQLFASTFLNKKVGENTQIDLHQDWSNTKESKWFSFGIWLALEDVNHENGCLYFVPKSHKIFRYVRTINHYPSPIKSLQEFLTKSTVNVPLKKGECILFDHAIVHGSYANRSTRDRVGIAIGGLPKDAPFLHYYNNSEKEANKVNISCHENSLEDYHKILESGIMNKNNILESVDFEYPQYKLEELENLLS